MIFGIMNPYKNFVLGFCDLMPGYRTNFISYYFTNFNTRLNLDRFFGINCCCFEVLTRRLGFDYMIFVMDKVE